MKAAAAGVHRSGTPVIQSLDRGLAILVAVAGQASPVPLAELRDLLGIDHSSAFRLANTLKRRGFLACPPGRKDYVLGPSIWRMSRHYHWSNMLIAVAHEPLRKLTAESGETSHLAVREGNSALFIDHVTSRHVISVSGQTGELVPLHCTAHGKALLIDCDLAKLRALLGGGPLKGTTKNTIVSLEKLARSCAKSRLRGYATDDGEYSEGIRCVAAPIRDSGGTVIASVGISAPLGRFPESRYAAAGRTICETAHEIGRGLSELDGEPEG